MSLLAKAMTIYGAPRTIVCQLYDLLVQETKRAKSYISEYEKSVLLVALCASQVTLLEQDQSEL